MKFGDFRVFARTDVTLSKSTTAGGPIFGKATKVATIILVPVKYIPQPRFVTALVETRDHYIYQQIRQYKLSCRESLYIK